MMALAWRAAGSITPKPAALVWPNLLETCYARERILPSRRCVGDEMITVQSLPHSATDQAVSCASGVLIGRRGRRVQFEATTGWQALKLLILLSRASTSWGLASSVFRKGF